MPSRGIENLPIVDAKTPFTLRITKDDIKRASRKEPDLCAVARSCHRGGAIEVRIHLARAYLRFNKANWQRYTVPLGLRTEIVAFDRGGEFTEGEWVLAPPRPSARLTGKRTGGKKDRYNHASKNPNRKKRARHVVTDVRTGPFV